MPPHSPQPGRLPRSPVAAPPSHVSTLSVPGRPAGVVSRVVLALTLVLGLAVLTPAVIAPASAKGSIEDYASWQPVKKCAPKPKPGTLELSRWLSGSFGGGSTSISRACGSSSEHTEGRAIDWSNDATRKADRRQVRQFLKRVLHTDRAGNTHAKARRMGIMYVIWNDKMYSAWNRFEPEPYLSSSCTKRRSCSKTLRHRDHVHISLTRRAARAKTSWYDAQR